MTTTYAAPGGETPAAGWVPPTWEEVVEQHSARVYRLAYRLTGQRARRRGPDPGRVRARVPLAAHLPAGHLRGLAAPHHDQRLPRQDAPQAADPLRRALRRVRRPAAQPWPGARAGATTTPTSTTTCSARSTPSRPTSAPPSCCATSRACPTRRSRRRSASSSARSARASTAGRAQLRESLAHRAPQPSTTTPDQAPRAGSSAVPPRGPYDRRDAGAVPRGRADGVRRRPPRRWTGSGRGTATSSPAGSAPTPSTQERRLRSALAGAPSMPGDLRSTPARARQPRSRPTSARARCPPHHDPLALARPQRPAPATAAPCAPPSSPPPRPGSRPPPRGASPSSAPVPVPGPHRPRDDATPPVGSPDRAPTRRAPLAAASSVISGAVDPQTVVLGRLGERAESTP